MDPPIVDVHSHVYLTTYRDAMREAGHDVPLPDRLSGLDAKLAFMAERGIERALVSLGNPWLDPLGDRGAGLAERLNAELAGLAGQTEGRLLGLGVIPQGSPDAAASSVSEIASEPRLFGAISGSRICGRPLDDVRLDPVWDALAAGGVPLLIHPHHGPGNVERAAGGSVLALGLGFPLETTLALGRLILGGVLDRFPSLRIVGAHAGGALPLLSGRLQAFWETRGPADEAVPGPPEALMRRLAFDAVGYSPAAVRAAIDLVGPERVFFGTDHPFPVARVEANRGALDAVVTDDERALVYGAGAADFFGLPPSPAAAS